MKNLKLILGIDISKKKLDVSLLDHKSGNELIHFVVPNNANGFKTIKGKIKSLKLQFNQCLFCFEDTGIYGINLAMFLSQYKVDFSIIPAIEIHRSKGISRGKSDRTDAKAIAFYALTHLHSLKLSVLPEKDILLLKVLTAERVKLVKTIRIMDSTNELKDFVPKDLNKIVLDINSSTMDMLKGQLHKIEAKILEVIKANSTLNQQFELICSVPGVGPKTAVHLIVTTRAFSCFKNWRKLACYAGVAPFEYTSGSSIKRRTKVHFLADKSLKSLLHMCALNMKKADRNIQLYYQRKIEKGKNPMLVMNAIRCKVISRVFAVVNRGAPYVNTEKFLA